MFKYKSEHGDTPYIATMRYLKSRGFEYEIDDYIAEYVGADLPDARDVNCNIILKNRGKLYYGYSEEYEEIVGYGDGLYCMPAKDEYESDNTFIIFYIKEGQILAGIEYGIDKNITKILASFSYCRGLGRSLYLTIIQKIVSDPGLNNALFSDDSVSESACKFWESYIPGTQLVTKYDEDGEKFFHLNINEEFCYNNSKPTNHISYDMKLYNQFISLFRFKMEISSMIWFESL